MPELPDVEIFRRYLEKTSLNQTIQKVQAENSVLEGISETDLKDSLTERTLILTRRHGKLLFAGVGKKGPWLVFHFGMTGYLRYLKSGDSETSHPRMIIDFHNRNRLVFDCRRKLGRIRITNDIEALLQEMKLGPDALEPPLEFAEFKKRMELSRGYIKSALMNQSIIAGIGNIYSDEILYQAGIYPKRKIGQIDKQEFGFLYNAMQKVLYAAIDAEADPAQMPSYFLISNRYQQAMCPCCAGRVEKISVSGRNGFCCPACQK